jgi:hypothetical protein
MRTRACQASSADHSLEESCSSKLVTLKAILFSGSLGSAIVLMRVAFCSIEMLFSRNHRVDTLMTAFSPTIEIKSCSLTFAKLLLPGGRPRRLGDVEFIILVWVNQETVSLMGHSTLEWNEVKGFFSSLNFSWRIKKFSAINIFKIDI